jgi:hypothetical protein
MGGSGDLRRRFSAKTSNNDNNTNNNEVITIIIVVSLWSFRGARGAENGQRSGD